MKFNKKFYTSLFAMAAASSFFMNVPVYANETAALEAPKVEYKGAIQGLNAAELNNEIQNKTQIQSGFVEKDNKTYYVDGFGQKLTGKQEIEGETFLFNKDGEMLKGLQTVDGQTYFFSKEDGAMETGEVKDGDKSYFLQNDGRMLKGWGKENGQSVYYNDNGFKIKNEIKMIDGKRYAFDENGIMLVNTSKDGYDFDADGVGTANASAYQRIADAALAQLGVYQDCTMLVTNSLRAVGINFHGWPAEYLSLGPLTNDPVPGDIVVYQGHVAIYIGNGKAVHGGWNGNQTVIWDVACSTPLIGFVHPILP